MEQHRTAERHQQDVNRRQKRIFPGGRVLQSDGLHNVRQPGQYADEQPHQHLSARQPPQVFAENRAADERRNAEAQRNHHRRRHTVQRIFHHCER